MIITLEAAYQSFKKNNFKKTLSILKKINKNNKSFGSLNLEALCYFELKQYASAKDTWFLTLLLTDNFKNKTLIYWYLSRCYINLNNIDEAKKILRTSISLDPSITNVDSRQLLCELAIKTEDFEIVEKYSKKLLSYEKSFLPASMILIQSAIGLGDKKLILQRIHSLDNHKVLLPPIYITAVTDCLITLSEYEKAKEFLVNYSDKYSKDFWFIVINAWIESELGLPELVISSLKDRIIGELPEWFKEKGLVFTLLGDAYAKTKDFEKAFDNFIKLGKFSVSKHKGLPKYDVLSSYKSIDISLLNYQTNSTDNPPVFMIGFPRSGTTLLETMLDQHPQIVGLSERPLISKVIKKINQRFNNKNIVKNLPKLNEEYILELRQYYLELASEYNTEIENKVLIDKMPLNTINIPLIKILFPNAKFIVNLRHPLDVVLSSFQQNFVANNEMAFLFTLEGCVNRYKQVFSFFEECNDKLELNHIKVKYEDLIENKENECSRIFNYLGVSNSINLDEFQDYAQEKVINTASRNQVTKKIYTTSRYKWKNYQEQLAHHKERLNYFIDKYGYTEK
jgi:tetratricopeptide (TPR) repeat protein